MPAHWDVEVGGQDYVVTVERAPQTGKDVVRVNGRVVAKPMGPEEQQREISIAGVPYILTRSAEGFDLTMDEFAAASAAAQARSLQTANTVLAHGDAPVALERDSFFSYLPKLGYVALVALVGLMVWYIARDRTADLAKERVEIVLREAAGGTGVTEQFAITYWAKNRKVLDNQEMAWASNAFDKWRREKDLYRKFGDYQVVSSDVVKDAPVPTAIVTFTIEGKTYKVRVPKDTPISWEE